MKPPSIEACSGKQLSCLMDVNGSTGISNVFNHYSSFLLWAGMFQKVKIGGRVGRVSKLNTWWPGGGGAIMSI